VTGFAAGLASQTGSLKMDARMRTRRKHPRDIRMAFKAGLVADVNGARNLWRRFHRFYEAGAGKEKRGTRSGEQAPGRQPTSIFHTPPPGENRRAPHGARRPGEGQSPGGRLTRGCTCGIVENYGRFSTARWLFFRGRWMTGFSQKCICHTSMPIRLAGAHAALSLNSPRRRPA